MTYDDMPVGTVLRNPDDGTTYVKTCATVHRRPYWVAVTHDGNANGTFAIEIPPFLVELVEKPAETPNLRDDAGDLWKPVESGYWYRLDDNDPDGLPVAYTYEAINDAHGPLTEEPS